MSLGSRTIAMLIRTIAKGGIMLQIRGIRYVGQILSLITLPSPDQSVWFGTERYHWSCVEVLKRNFLTPDGCPMFLWSS